MKLRIGSIKITLEVRRVANNSLVERIDALAKETLAGTEWSNVKMARIKAYRRLKPDSYLQDAKYWVEDMFDGDGHGEPVNDKR